MRGGEVGIAGLGGWLGVGGKTLGEREGGMAS